MTALAENRRITMRGVPDTKYYPVAASTLIYAGGMVNITSGGVAVPAADTLVGPRGVVGVAAEKADNSSGSAGDISVKVLTNCEFQFAATTATGAVQQKCWAEDDQTVDETTGSNQPVAGIITEVIGASSVWVYISPTVIGL